MINPHCTYQISRHFHSKGVRVFDALFLFSSRNNGTLTSISLLTICSRTNSSAKCRPMSNVSFYKDNCFLNLIASKAHKSFNGLEEFQTLDPNLGKHGNSQQWNTSLPNIRKLIIDPGLVSDTQPTQTANQPHSLLHRHQSGYLGSILLRKKISNSSSR